MLGPTSSSPPYIFESNAHENGSAANTVSRATTMGRRRSTARAKYFELPCPSTGMMSVGRARTMHGAGFPGGSFRISPFEKISARGSGEAGTTIRSDRPITSVCIGNFSLFHQHACGAATSSSDGRTAACEIGVGHALPRWGIRRKR